MKRAKSENGGGENERQPYLSGAYIRSFVKQLSSSRSMREKESSEERERSPMMEQDPAPAKPHKKQVRRRLQTRKPYQEKLLNMAEARREIVTALKLHRASMKEATQNQQHQIPSPPDFQTEQKSRRNPRIYASNAEVDNFSETNAFYSPNFYSWPIPSAPPPPPPPLPVFQDSLDFVLPTQALGLNLNLQDFISAPSSSIYSSSTSSSPPPAAEIRSCGDERFEFLNCGGEDEREEELVSSPFDEVMEFPPWLNANESCFHHVQDYFHGPVLPW